MLVDDTHSEPEELLFPSLKPPLAIDDPTDEKQTVTLTDPVVGAFVVATLLTASDPPP